MRLNERNSGRGAEQNRARGPSQAESANVSWDGSEGLQGLTRREGVRRHIFSHLVVLARFAGPTQKPEIAPEAFCARTTQGDPHQGPGGRERPDSRNSEQNSFSIQLSLKRRRRCAEGKSRGKPGDVEGGSENKRGSLMSTGVNTTYFDQSARAIKVGMVASIEGSTMAGNRLYVCPPHTVRLMYQQPLASREPHYMRTPSLEARSIHQLRLPSANN
ncbi:hypothetical protein B0H16DRAFT_1455092 [Mycena metata]|uniref:Uncharacterized protein n=1 Tax=Mycena metata TaxID=1033252 RepID=A0AAD7NJT7_9AGAR|nr:hypothetical protein B0H16DRAFT_1455092 [Mycena metata]